MTPELLKQRLDYIEFRRAGGSLKPQIEGIKEEKLNEVEQTVSALAKQLVNKQGESKTTIDSLVIELESTGIFEPAETQLRNLRTTLSELKQMQTKLEAVNTTTEKEMKGSTDQRVELQNMVANLRQKLNSRQNQMIPYQEQINRCGGNVCQKIAGIPAIKRE